MRVVCFRSLQDTVNVGGWNFLQGGVLFSLFNFTLTNIFTLGKIKTYIFLSLYQDKFSKH